MGLIRRGLSLLREEGIFSFLSGVSEYLRLQIALMKGSMSLSVGGVPAVFNAESEGVVRKTKTRYEEKSYEIERILREVSDGNVFYYIGANTGLYSCFVSNAEADCEVVAFEPYPPNVEELNKNKNLNRADRISVHNVALSDESGTVSFSTPEEPTIGHGTGVITEAADSMSVRSKRGDELISDRKVKPPNVVKIDVEGAEPLVVDGLQNALAKESCRLVFCELHPSELSEHGYDTSRVVPLLEEMGYDVELHERWDDGKVIEAQRGPSK